MNFKSVPTGKPANPFEAFRQLAYAHGVAELAQQMGLKPGTLYNKADADEDTHHQPSLRDVVLATRLTGDMRVLDALNESFGRAAFDLNDCGEKSDEALMDLLNGLDVQKGEFHKALRNAFADKRFEIHEFVLVRAEAFQMVSALMTLVNRLEGLIDV